jgi:hypothetical protein
VISTNVYWPSVSAADAFTWASMPKNQRGSPRAVGDWGAVDSWVAMSASFGLLVDDGSGDYN